MKIKSIFTVLVACCMIFAFAGCDSDSSSGDVISTADKSDLYIGYIMYTDGTKSLEYDSGKTPIGIIIECDDDTGAPEKILSHKMGAACEWALNTAWGATNNCGTETDDGEDNLGKIQDAILAAGGIISFGEFPVFNTAYNWDNWGAVPFPAGWEKWYVPALNDWNEIINNYEKITAALAKFGSMSDLVDFSQEFWTSSESSGTTNAWTVQYNGGTLNESTCSKTELHNAVFMTEIYD